MNLADIIAPGRFCLPKASLAPLLTVGLLCRFPVGRSQRISPIPIGPDWISSSTSGRVILKKRSFPNIVSDYCPSCLWNHERQSARETWFPRTYGKAQSADGGLRWEWSLPITATYDVVGFPRAHDKIPQTYRSLGGLTNLGRCVPVQQAEYQALLILDIEPVTLHLSKRAQEVLNLNTNNKDLREEISRLVAGIKHDIAVAGMAKTGTNPLRFAPNDSDLFLMLMRRWDEQDGMCALCDRRIPLKPENKLLKMSRDRTDSANEAYEWQNTHLTHFACNVGKSDATVDEWRDYLKLVRQA
jgi:hypothetical protein